MWKGKHKFHAKPTEVDNIKFGSKLEANVYLKLKALKEDKRILFFLRQIPFDLPGNHRHKIDYCIFTIDEVLFVECKGFDSPIGKLKRKQVEDLYQIPIHILKKPMEIYEMVSPRRE